MPRALTQPLRLDTTFCPPEWLDQTEEILPRAKEALHALQQKTCRGSEWTGWFDYPRLHGAKLLDDIAAYQRSLTVVYDTLVVVGIGGSYLGTRALWEACQTTAKKSPRPVKVIFAGQHLSEYALLQILADLEGRLPLVNVISKSGTTTETAVAFRCLKSYLQQRFGAEEAKRRIVVTTDPERGALREFATRQSLSSFSIPPDIGGRYSVLTAVGMLPLSLMGFSVREVMDGAAEFFASVTAGQDTAAERDLLRLTALRHIAFNSGKSVDLMTYSEPGLGQFTEWWKQLFGESEGKDGQGLFPASLSLTTDLHSLGQFVQDGTRIFLETFLLVDEVRSAVGGPEKRLKVEAAGAAAGDDISYLENLYINDINLAAARATRVAHFDGGVPSVELTVRCLDAYHLGYLVAFFQTACAVSGALLGVNPFDQPGVEDYKVNLFGLLGKPGFEAQGEAIRRRI